HRRTVRAGHPFSDAARVLSGLSRDCRRPWRERLLATLAFAAVLAGRAAMVFVPTVGVEFSRGCAAPLRSIRGRTVRSAGGLCQWKSGPVLCRSGGGIRAGLCAL